MQSVAIHSSDLIIQRQMQEDQEFKISGSYTASLKAAQAVYKDTIPTIEIDPRIMDFSVHGTELHACTLPVELL